jgi:hypothetical protein
MASVAEFWNDPDWQQSSGPHIDRAFDASADLWPHGAGSEIDGGDKDVLADGLHPVLAIGPRAQRPRNLTGAVILYNSVNDRAILNLGEKVVVRQYVSNILTYSGGAGNTFDQSFAIGEPVFVDDSGPLSAGVTLSRSPLNESDTANPLAGYLFYCQDDYVDTYIGGAGANVSWPITIANTNTETAVCVMLVNDFGIGNVDPTP